MQRFDSPLTNIRIASPCSANWAEMYGNEQKRFCGDCKLNVYNLSGMSKTEAEDLLTASEGRLCVRYFQRADGTVLTADCPVGWEMVRRRLSVYTTAIFSLIIGIFSGLFSVSIMSRQSAVMGKFEVPPKYEPLMGAVALPSPTPKPKSSSSPNPREVMGNITAPQKITLPNSNKQKM